MKKLRFSESLAIGLLLFGMLFGAGNIIFPVMLGQNAGGNYLLASLGFLITGVGLPILAIASFALSKKTTLKDYASPVGGFFSYFFTVTLLMTIGPLFATPRTATVAFEVGFQPYLAGTGHENLALLIYSTIFFALVLYFSFRPNQILDIIGKFLSPLFVILISFLIGASLLFPMAQAEEFEALGTYEAFPFIQGILDGYNTMDILACLAFAFLIIENIRAFGIKKAEHVARETRRSSKYTLILMAFLYMGLTYLGASSRGIMDLQANGGLVLAKVAHHYFGHLGQILLAAIVTVACLKTAIGLSVSISRTFHQLFPKLLSEKSWTVIFALVSFTIANFGLNTIIRLSVPVLMFLYPLAITLILLWLINFLIPLKELAFKVTLSLALIPAFFDFLKAAPAPLSTTPMAQSLLQLPDKYLPFFDLGMAWLLPVALGLAISLVFFRKKGRD